MTAHTTSGSAIASNGDPSEGRKHLRPISDFIEGAASRRLLRQARAEQRAVANGIEEIEQKPWGLLYKALTNALGASPRNFQLIYPFTSWNWPTPAAGTIGAAQYDFCATSPQWSAVGAYASGGDHVDKAYQQFLNVIPAATEDPILRDQIEEASNALTEATNKYTLAHNAALAVYEENVQDNTPSFTEWLGTPAGLGYQTYIRAAAQVMAQSEINLAALVVQANTPGLGSASEQFNNEEFKVRLADPSLSKLPKVRNWTIAQSAAQWLQKVKAGKGPAGATMGFTNREAQFDYGETWAGGKAKIPQLFWEVKVNGKWERVEQFESDHELEVSLTFAAFELIQIQPGAWYDGAFVRSMAKGPFVRGYSPDGSDDTQAVFGEKGFFGLIKTGMYVGYKPSFSIRSSASTFKSFSEKFKVAGGLRIGPFTFEANGGSEKSGWASSENGFSFTGTTTSDQPMIIGVQIAELPYSSEE
jgi:hypothetical protein